VCAAVGECREWPFSRPTPEEPPEKGARLRVDKKAGETAVPCTAEGYSGGQCPPPLFQNNGQK